MYQMFKTIKLVIILYHIHNSLTQTKLSLDFGTMNKHTYIRLFFCKYIDTYHTKNQPDQDEHP